MSSDRTRDNGLKFKKKKRQFKYKKKLFFSFFFFFYCEGDQALEQFVHRVCILGNTQNHLVSFRGMEDLQILYIAQGWPGLNEQVHVRYMCSLNRRYRSLYSILCTLRHFVVSQCWLLKWWDLILLIVKTAFSGCFLKVHWHSFWIHSLWCNQTRLAHVLSLQVVEVLPPHLHRR